MFALGSIAEQVSRVRQMADRSGTWDLSDNDVAALRTVLEQRDALLAALLGFMDQPDTAESYDKAMAAAEAAIQSATGA